jgi:hypothetical protein
MILRLQQPFECAAFMAVVVHEGEHTHFRHVYHTAKNSVRDLLSVLLDVQGGLWTSRRLLSGQTEFAWQILCEAEAGLFRQTCPLIGSAGTLQCIGGVGLCPIHRGFFAMSGHLSKPRSLLRFDLTRQQ